jgi:hypothetical protein
LDSGVFIFVFADEKLKLGLPHLQVVIPSLAKWVCAIEAALRHFIDNDDGFILADNFRIEIFLVEKNDFTKVIPEEWHERRGK